MVRTFIYCFLALLAISCSKKDRIEVEWTDGLTGDYSFTERWDYDENIYHTIECEAQCYEWAGTNSMEAIRISPDSVKAYTLCNPATHSSLVLNIINGACIPKIELNSITPVGFQSFDCDGGYIKIDKPLWNKGILKAEFHFTFENKSHPSDSLRWQGRVYTTINENKRSF